MLEPGGSGGGHGGFGVRFREHPPRPLEPHTPQILKRGAPGAQERPLYGALRHPGTLGHGEVNGMPTIYALSTNNGIQALQIVPEPSTTLAAGVCTVGLAGMMLRGRRRSQDG